MKRAPRAAVAALAFALAAAAQVATEANRHYQTPEDRASMAASLGDPARDARQKPRELVRAMQIARGSVVADVGTAVGYMLPYLSEAVGPAGHVIAEDIFADFLDKARAAAAHSGLSNVTFVLGTETDPRLPASGVDTILALDVYHHFNYPDKMLAGMRKALRPGGRLFIVEYYRREGAMPGMNALQHIRLDADGVVKEVSAAGFDLAWRRDHVPGSQYIACFVRK